MIIHIAFNARLLFEVSHQARPEAPHRETGLA